MCKRFDRRASGQQRFYPCTVTGTLAWWCSEVDACRGRSLILVIEHFEVDGDYTWVMHRSCSGVWVGKSLPNDEYLLMTRSAFMRRRTVRRYEPVRRAPGDILRPICVLPWNDETRIWRVRPVRHRAHLHWNLSIHHNMKARHPTTHYSSTAKDNRDGRERSSRRAHERR